MRLHEYQSKKIFGQYGIPIPKGKLATSASQVKHITEELGTPVILKSQVRVSGRGKAGGIRLARTVKEAEELAALLLNRYIKGLPVHKLLVDQVAIIEKELYLAIITDRSASCPLIISSISGGVDIEEIAHHFPEKIIKVGINPLMGLSKFNMRELAFGINLPKTLWKDFEQIAAALYRIYVESDAELVEINPLIINSENKFLALDGKIILDENALYRHMDLLDVYEINGEDPLEIEARKFGLNYVRLEGYIGCLVNGAGLAMATMDTIHFFGGKPANFLDIGGGANVEKVAAGLRIVLSDENVKSLLVNIFGGITHCDKVAEGILSVLNDDKPNIPIVVRLVGRNSEAARQLLQGRGYVSISDTMENAAQSVIDKSGEVVQQS